MADDPAAQAILAVLAARGPEKSICPTEAARALAGNPADESWRACLPAIRRAAISLAGDEKIQIMRKGKPIAPADMHGVIRLKLR